MEAGPPEGISMIDQKFARRGLLLVFLILFLDVIGIAIIMPVMPKYLEELTGASVSAAGSSPTSTPRR